MANVSAAIRKLKKRKFPSQAKACTPRTITIKLKNGRTKKFVGRPGGAGKNGICGQPPAAVRANRAAFRKAVKACPKRGQAKLNCIGKKMKAA